VPINCDVITGANIAGTIYQPHITSYDYDCPIGEAGLIGQPGIGGDNKFKVSLAQTMLYWPSTEVGGLLEAAQGRQWQCGACL
jgi:hypothetical protein